MKNRQISKNDVTLQDGKPFHLFFLSFLRMAEGRSGRSGYSRTIDFSGLPEVCSFFFFCGPSGLGKEWPEEKVS